MKLEMATIQIELDPSDGAGEGGIALQAVALAGLKDWAVRGRKDKWKGVCSQRGREFWTIGPWYPFPFSFLFYLGSAMSCSYIRK